MTYDLELLQESALSCGFKVNDVAENILKVELMPGVVLGFQNYEDPEESLIGFQNVGWHTHGDLNFSDKEGRYLELEYINLLTELKAGNVLVCDEYCAGTLRNRSLVHRKYSDEVRFMKPGDEIRFRQCA